MNMNPMENITQYFKPHIFHYCEPFHSRPAKSFFSGLCHHLSLSPVGTINHFSVYRFNIILRQSSCYHANIYRVHYTNSSVHSGLAAGMTKCKKYKALAIIIIIIIIIFIS